MNLKRTVLLKAYEEVGFDFNHIDHQFNLYFKDKLLIQWPDNTTMERSQVNSVAQTYLSELSTFRSYR